MNGSRIERLNQIGIALSSETNLDRLLELIVTEARAFTGADAGSLYTLEQDKRLIFRVAQNDTLDKRSKSGSTFVPHPITLDTQSIAGYVALTGEVLNLEDVHKLPKNAPYSFNARFDTDSGYVTQSMLVVPMKDSQGDVLGVLQLINAKNRKGTVTTFSPTYQSLTLSLASQAGVAIRNARLIAYIKGLFEALIQYSASAIDARSPHTAGHSRRVAGYSLLIAKAMNREQHGPLGDINFSEDELDRLAYAAWLHDIGKIGVPEHILDKRWRLPIGQEKVLESRFQLAGACALLEAYKKGGKEADLRAARDLHRSLAQKLERLMKINAGNWLSDEDAAFLEQMAKARFTDVEGKQQALVTPRELAYLSIKKGNLTPEEYQTMQGHVEYTLRIVKNIPFTGILESVPQIAASHHEMLDGSGYPAKLRKDEICMEARILAMVDIFDALTASDRPYRRAMPAEKACAILKAEADKGRLDPDIVDLFVSQRLYEQLEEHSPPALSAPRTMHGDRDPAS